MGSSQSAVSSSALSGAQFVSDGLPAVKSYPRCHIFGDSSLYSVGIRTGYYLQYLAAALSILFLRGQDLRAWLLSFAPLVAAHFVVLLINSTGPGLIILDWEIVFGLVFWSFAFLVRAIFYRPVDKRPDAGLLLSYSRGLQRELTQETGRFVSDQEAEWDKRYATVVKVLGREASQKGDGDRQISLQSALREYVEAFTTARVAPGYGEASNYIISLYEDSERVRDIAARMLISNDQVESFRDAHAEALRLAGVPFDQAQTTMHAIARIAMEELYPGTPIRSGRRSPVQVATDFESWTGTFGLLGSGFLLVLYAGYLAFTIWVLFRGVEYGRKNRCDVRIIFVVVPTSVYSSAAITALRVLACFWLVLAGIPAFLAGAALLVIGVSSWWTQRPLSLRAGGDKNLGQRADTSAGAFKAVPYDRDPEKGKGPGLVGTGTGSTSGLQNPGAYLASRSSDRFFETSELPTQQQSMSSLRKETEGGRGSSPDDLAIEESSTTGPAIRGGAGAATGTAWILVKSKWEYLFLILLVHTIIVVEVTIRINGLDMRQRAFSSLGEFLAFFLGVFLLVRVVARCASAAIKEKRRRNSARWFEERWRVLMDKPKPSGPATIIRRADTGYTSGGSGTGGPLEAKSPISPVSPTSAGGISRKESLQRVATWHTTGRQSGSSMGRFKEMIDEG
ncbi:hypothetical protein V8F20_011087 [Naviculisporaceae sp. PSN 640]